MISDIIYKMAFDKSFGDAYQIAYYCPFLRKLSYNHSVVDFYFSDGSHLAFGREYIPSFMNIPSKEDREKIESRYCLSKISFLNEKSDNWAKKALNEIMCCWVREIK